eukprot:gene2414-7727_t
MCEVWSWLVCALREEDYAWRNVAFYRGFALARPAGFSLDQLLRPRANGGRAGDYDWLEREHGWVQWAFPTLLHGTNPHASPLTHAEVAVLRHDADLRRKAIGACGVLLDFLGLQLTRPHGAEGPGGVRVSKVMGGGWDARARNWACNLHNNKRVTRMLTFMCLIGCDAHARAFMRFAREEIANGDLQWCRASVKEHWGPAAGESAPAGTHGAAPGAPVPACAPPPAAPPGRRSAVHSDPTVQAGDLLAVRLGISPHAARTLLSAPFRWDPQLTAQEWGRCRRGPPPGGTCAAPDAKLMVPPEARWAQDLGCVPVNERHSGRSYAALQVLPVPSAWAHFTLGAPHPRAGTVRTVAEHFVTEHGISVDTGCPVLLARELAPDGRHVLLPVDVCTLARAADRAGTAAGAGAGDAGTGQGDVAMHEFRCKHGVYAARRWRGLVIVWWRSYGENTVVPLPAGVPLFPVARPAVPFPPEGAPGAYCASAAAAPAPAADPAVDPAADPAAAPPIPAAP